jgi:PPOX class probable F420-dependent enzyme
LATLTDAQRQLFLDKNFVAVATLGKDGTPRNTIVWVHADEKHIIINGAQSRGWIKNLRRNPHVALTIYDHEKPYRRVTVIGEAVEMTTEGGEENIDELSMKYGGNLYPDHQPNNPRVLVRIRPDTVTAMGV